MAVELAAWAEVDATEWKTVAGHVVGKREKHWVADAQGETWLAKFPNPVRPSELAIEVFTSALATSLGLDTPTCRAATVGDRFALVSRSFVADGEQILHGDQLLEDIYPSYDSADHHAHTLTAVRKAIESRLGSPGVELFARVLAFDAWVGNGDRHQQNWGIVVGKDSVRLTPVYDTAACLGAEVTDTGARNLASSTAALRRYVLKCPSGFGDGVALLSMAAVVDQLRAWPEGSAAIATGTSAFRAALGPAQTYVRSIPEAWLTAGHRALACELLASRLDWLEETSR